MIGKTPDDYVCAEKSFITYISVAQLLACGSLAWSVHKLVEGHRPDVRSPNFIWAIVACGFLFLALDDALRIHERVDKLVHSVFNLTETALTDSIDDQLILLYAIVGTAILWRYVRALGPLADAWAYLGAGAVFTLAMVGFDILTNRPDTLNGLIGPGELSSMLFQWCGVAEETCKLLGGASLLASMRAARERAAAMQRGEIVPDQGMAPKNGAVAAPRHE